MPRQKKRSRARAAAAEPVLRVSDEAALLTERVLAEAPPPGTQATREELAFGALPLSRRTLEGLSAGEFATCTEIQQAAVPHALAGRDILGAAKTGSGKTLAFLVPLLEALFRGGVEPGDGLAGLVISPTRELAMQIFEVLRRVGRAHRFSAGLITGGKQEFQEEQQRIGRMNLLVCTPGRLLQHLEQTPNFSADEVKVLVLDEADRILDLGFRDQLDRILAYLPAERQTMLFSATQTKRIKDLARLSLREPEYLAVHEASEVVPERLVQSFVAVPAERKLSTLWSFIRSHLKTKTIVFFNTCSQVRYVHALFSGMQPGVPLVALHGKLKQVKRTHIYYQFLRSPTAVLFATDVASRGLDFPNVDWVVQADAPEDAAMYIHRVGRTARFNAEGRGLLFLMPEEESAVLEELGEKRITVAKLHVNPKKTEDMDRRAAAELARKNEVRLLAQKAFTSYLRSLLLLPGDRALRPTTLDLAALAASMGLSTVPDLGSLRDLESGRVNREDVRAQKNSSKSLQRLKDQMKKAKQEKRRLREAREREKKAEMAARLRQASGGASGGDTGVVTGDAAAADEEDDLLTVKRRHDWQQPLPEAPTATEDGAMDAEGSASEEGDTSVEAAQESRKRRNADRKAAKAKRLRIDGTGVARAAEGERMRFDAEGTVAEREARRQLQLQQEEELDEAELRTRSQAFQKEVEARLRASEGADRDAEKARIRAKHRKVRLEARGPMD